MYIHKPLRSDIKTLRQADRQAERQADIETVIDILTDRLTNRPAKERPDHLTNAYMVRFTAY